MLQNFNVDSAISSTFFSSRKDNYKNANEMFNDKSEINKSRNIYEKYSIIDDYDDEYDDTYDSHDIGNTRDDSTEVGLKPFTIPRVSMSILILLSILQYFCSMISKRYQNFNPSSV